MTEVGGILPPRPMTVAAGSALPCERTVVVGDTSSVVVRFAVVAPPGRNSLTVAFTRTASPTLTEVGALPVNTKMPWDVAESHPFDRRDVRGALNVVDERRRWRRRLRREAEYVVRRHVVWRVERVL